LYNFRDKDGKDWFGVPWVYGTSESAFIPDHRCKPILEDICDWKEVVQWPDLDAIDWEAAAISDGADKADRENYIYSVWDGRTTIMPQVLPAKPFLLAFRTTENPHFMDVCHIDMEQVGQLPHFDQIVLDDGADQLAGRNLIPLLTPYIGAQPDHVHRLV